jgi:hypothetical protein
MEYKVKMNFLFGIYNLKKPQVWPYCNTQYNNILIFISESPICRGRCHTNVLAWRKNSISTNAVFTTRSVYMAWMEQAKLSNPESERRTATRMNEATS